MTTQLSQSPGLADQRKAKGVSLWSIEFSTKINPRFLEAIEAEDFAKLPGGVYTLNYLRQYARVVGLDEADLLQRYYDKTQPPISMEPAPAQSKLTRWLRECQLSRAFFHRPPRRNESRSPA
jgi:cytoskeletal protein RodZ